MFGSHVLSPERFSELERVARSWGVPSPLEVPFPGQGYRHRVRLSVRGRPGKLAVGLFQAGTHDLVAIPGCPVHHPTIEQVLSHLIPLLNSAKISPYVEPSHQGLLRALQIAISAHSGKAQVTLLIRDALAFDHKHRQVFLPLIEQLSRLSPLNGVFLGALPDKTNALSARRYEKLWGEDCLVDEAGGATLFFPPDAFGQANPILHERVLLKIKEFLPQGSPVTEYYAGVGSLGLGLIAAGHDVHFNEVGAGSLSGLRLGLAHLGVETSRETITEGVAGDHATLYGLDDTVVVDPPRKGLDPPLLRRLTKEPPVRLIYLSCGLDSFLKEIEQLKECGLYEMRHLSGWGYFPFSEHIETLAVLERTAGFS